MISTDKYAQTNIWYVVKINNSKYSRIENNIRYVNDSLSSSYQYTDPSDPLESKSKSKNWVFREKNYNDWRLLWSKDILNLCKILNLYSKYNFVSGIFEWKIQFTAKYFRKTSHPNLNTLLYFLHSSESPSLKVSIKTNPSNPLIIFSLRAM